jgi:uncharacterized protein (TIGR02145 family)
VNGPSQREFWGVREKRMGIIESSQHFLFNISGNELKHILYYFFSCMIILVSSCADNPSTSIDVKPKDTISKDTIQIEVVPEGALRIGKQIWMKENLNICTYRNGDSIIQAKTQEEWTRLGHSRIGAWCYYSFDERNEKKYGKLYNGYAVFDKRGLAPKGYHIPSDAEWTILVDFCGGEQKAGISLKSDSDWIENSKSSNSTGFTAIPGGLCDHNGNFSFIGEYGYWWSSTNYLHYDVWIRSLGYDHSKVERGFTNKVNGCSVRCIKN